MQCILHICHMFHGHVLYIRSQFGSNFSSNHTIKFISMGTISAYLAFMLIVLGICCTALRVDCTTNPNTADVLSAIKAKVELVPGTPVPGTPDCSRFCGMVPSLGRRLILASPCCGIHGSMFALQAMNVHTDSVANYVLDDTYRYFLEKHLIAGGMRPEDVVLHLGEVYGDLLKVRLSALPRRVDLLCAGPPCPPWSRSGSKASYNDDRAKVFFRILVWVFYLVRCSGLLAVVLENVEGILTKYGNRESVMSMFLRLLNEYLPEFVWQVDIVRALLYQTAQKRVRVFLRGMRRVVCSVVPAVMPAFGERPLRTALGRLL